MHIPSLLALNNEGINYSIQDLFFSIITAKEENITDELKLNTLKDIHSFPHLQFNSLDDNLRTQFFMILQQLSEKYPHHDSIISVNHFLQQFWNTSVENIISQHPNFSLQASSIFWEELNYLSYFANYPSYVKEFELQALSKLYDIYQFSIPEEITHYQELYHIVKQLDNKECSLELLDSFWIKYGHRYDASSIDHDYFKDENISSQISEFYHHHLTSLRSAIATCLFKHFIHFPHEQSQFKSFPHFFQFCDWLEIETLHHMHFRYEEHHLVYLHQLSKVEGYHYYVNHFFGVIPNPSVKNINYWNTMVQKAIDYDILLRNVKNDKGDFLKKSFYEYLTYSYDEIKQILNSNQYDSLEDAFDPFSFDDGSHDKKVLASLKQILDRWTELHLNFDLHHSLEHKAEQYKPKL